MIPRRGKPSYLLIHTQFLIYLFMGLSTSMKCRPEHERLMSGKAKPRLINKTADVLRKNVFMTSVRLGGKS